MSAKGPIVHKTRTQAVAERLREQILAGEIEAGEPLRQDAIARAFNVSRIPVREALLLLEAEGLVQFEAHKGASATELSIERIDELFELRQLIECQVFARALDNMRPEDLEDAEQILHELDHVLDTGTRVSTWSELNRAFHEALYRSADRPQSLELIRTLNTRCDRYIRIQLLYTAGIAKAESEHRELLELSRRGEKEQAVDLLARHILDAGEAIKKLLLEQQGQRSSSLPGARR